MSPPSDVSNTATPVDTRITLNEKTGSLEYSSRYSGLPDTWMGGGFMGNGTSKRSVLSVI